MDESRTLWFRIDMLFIWPSLNATPHLSSAETPKQVAHHEVPPGLRSSRLRRSWAGGPGEGGLHRVRAVLREEGGHHFPYPSSSSSSSSLVPPAASQQGPPGRALRLQSRPFQTWLRIIVLIPDMWNLWKELTQQDQRLEHRGWFRSSCWGWILVVQGLNCTTCFQKQSKRIWTDISTLVVGFSCIGLRITIRFPLVFLHRPRLLLLSTFAGFTDSSGGCGAPNVIWPVLFLEKRACEFLFRGDGHNLLLSLWFLTCLNPFWVFLSCAGFVPD